MTFEKSSLKTAKAFSKKMASKGAIAFCSVSLFAKHIISGGKLGE